MEKIANFKENLYLDKITGDVQSETAIKKIQFYMGWSNRMQVGLLKKSTS